MGDWEKAITDLCKTGDGDLDVEIELLVVEAEVVPLARETEPAQLSTHGLQIKTYFFEYPGVDQLVDFLGSELEGKLVGTPFEYNHLLGKVLAQAGLEYLDDFTLVLPWSLSHYAAIPVGVIDLLYSGAEKMIWEMHSQLEQEIRQIEGALQQAVDED
ncbi:hypothetical protein BDZ94DRAFT_1240523 [Collybia nuda]|uniref:Uncharacterized protein n=1 Tax=Collybia nuda TaxID=64659 RepID=A0A9P5XXX0_9AGAR|nr:hypothetical protein BDZ94DRAFT_1240523 [Collybia nuda]